MTEVEDMRSFRAHRNLSGGGDSAVNLQPALYFHFVGQILEVRLVIHRKTQEAIARETYDSTYLIQFDAINVGHWMVLQ